MIRLKVEYFEDKIQGFITWFNNIDTYGDGIDVKRWVSLREFAYRDVFNVTLTDCSFAFAVGINGKTEDRYKGFIEFNPNKCMHNKQFKRILDELFSVTFSRQVSRYDIAIDIPLPKYLVALDKDGRNYQYIKGKRSESEYLGVRNKLGFVKLYDKTAESGLSYDLTRLEITTDGKDINFPNVKIKRLQQNLLIGDLSSTERVLVQLLSQVDNKQIYLAQLNYRKRKKIEGCLGEDTLQYDKSACYEIRKQALQYQC